MFNAYSLEEVVSKLPLEANSITNNVDTLLIGSKQGHLICCSQSLSSGYNSFDYQLCRGFEKSKILALSVIESPLDLIVCLTDSHLSVHEAVGPYRLLHAFSKYRQIYCFSCSNIQGILYISISVKNRLVILQLFEERLEEIGSIPLEDSALRILWCQPFNTLFLSAKSQHFFTQLSIVQNADGKPNSFSVDQLPRSLFSIDWLSDSGTNNNHLSGIPLPIVLLEDRQLVSLCSNSKTVEFANFENGGRQSVFPSVFGSHQREVAGDFDEGGLYCQFSDSVVELAYDSPFLVGILVSGYVEVRLIQPSVLIQKISLNKAFMLTVGQRGCIYAANETQAWKLDTWNKIRDNLKFLKSVGQLEVALQFASVYADVVDVNEIGNLKKSIAAKSFVKRKFSKCFEIHLELKTDLLFVINLFPSLLPEKYGASTLKYLDELKFYGLDEKPLRAEELIAGIEAFVQFISMKRQEHSKPINLHYLDYKEGHTEHLLSTNSLKRHEAALELIDTVLLKSYLLVNPKLVGPLLRLKNCCCIISEAEKDLKSAGLYEELLVLYERKKMYRKHLEFLQREVKIPSTNHALGIGRMAAFLMKLRQDHLPLILEFASVVLAENLELGVKIFTGTDSPMDAAKNFDRDAVLQFLKRQFPAAVIPYLEHIIVAWEDKRPKFHEELLLQYITRVKSLIADYVKSMPENSSQIYPLRSSAATADGEEDELTALRKKLRSFLENDKSYTIKDTLKLVEADENMAEEQAILYGRLGRHKEALSIYTNNLVDFTAAERHCQKYYDEKDVNNSQIFFNLFCFYVSGSIPSSNKKELPKQNSSPLPPQQRRQNITEALKLLRRHANKINIVKAFALIPFETPLSRINLALKAVFETLCSRLTSLNLLLALTQIAINRTEANLKLLRQQRVHINERVVCFMCKKRIMESAFVRHRFDSISHFFCYKQNLERLKRKLDDSKEGEELSSLID